MWSVTQMIVSLTCITLNTMCTDVDVVCQSQKSHNDNNDENFNLNCRVKPKNLQIKLRSMKDNDGRQPFTSPSNVKLKLSLTTLSYVNNGTAVRCRSSNTSEMEDALSCMVDDSNPLNSTNATKKADGGKVDKGNDLSLRLTAACVTTAFFFVVLLVGVFVQ